MPNQPVMNPLVLVKLVLWIATIIVATLLLTKRRVTSGLRLAFLIGGVLLFGFVFGALIPNGQNPNPVASVRTLLAGALIQGKLLAPVAAMLLVLLVASWISNKSICGWACQLGLLQDLLYRLKLPKWQPPFWLSNGIRVLAFLALAAGMAVAGLDWIGVIDPFALFQFDMTLWIAISVAVILLASLFAYRPWCRFLCPFGLLSWVAEQKSLLRPRVNRDACIQCQRCVKACPSGAMADFYADKACHADCFACGACIATCPKDDALAWHK